jgi:hypothetical protein
MPNTTQYMLLGLGAVGGLIGIYSLTLMLRFRTVKLERQLIEQYED